MQSKKFTFSALFLLFLFSVIAQEEYPQNPDTPTYGEPILIENYPQKEPVYKEEPQYANEPDYYEAPAEEPPSEQPYSESMVEPAFPEVTQEIETFYDENIPEISEEKLPEEMYQEEIPEESVFSAGDEQAEEEFETFQEDELTQEDYLALGISEDEVGAAEVEVEEIFEEEETYSFEEIIPPTEEFAKEFEELRQEELVEVEVTTKVFEIEHEGKEIIKSKITVEVPATKETLEKGEVLVHIPKEIAQSTDQITFSEKPIIVEKDPLVKWEFKDVPQGSSKAYFYIVDGNAQNYKTIAVAAEKKEEVKVQQESGAFGLIIFLLLGGCVLFAVIKCFKTFIKKP